MTALDGNRISKEQVRSCTMDIRQRKYYDHIIRKEADLNRIRNYIRNNPAKWDIDEVGRESRSLPHDDATDSTRGSTSRLSIINHVAAGQKT